MLRCDLMSELPLVRRGNDSYGSASSLMNRARGLDVSHSDKVPSDQRPLWHGNETRYEFPCRKWSSIIQLV